MKGDRGNMTNPAAGRRGATGRRRQGRRAEVDAFEAWQRRQGAYQLTIPGRRPRRT